MIKIFNKYRILSEREYSDIQENELLLENEILDLELKVSAIRVDNEILEEEKENSLGLLFWLCISIALNFTFIITMAVEKLK